MSLKDVEITDYVDQSVNVSSVGREGLTSERIHENKKNTNLNIDKLPDQESVPESARQYQLIPHC